eukprot:1592990-Amphidinium_carterae.1
MLPTVKRGMLEASGSSSKPQKRFVAARDEIIRVALNVCREGHAGFKAELVEEVRLMFIKIMGDDVSLANERSPGGYYRLAEMAVSFKGHGHLS